MNEIAIPILETARLRLRPLAKSDIDDYAALYADPEVLRYLGGGAQPWDRGRSSRHMAFVAGQWLVGDAGMWAVEHKETGAFLGVIGFSSPEGWPGFELAWALARRWWGHGYATEGARAALAYAFTVLEKDRVISLIHPENGSSIRVAERIGETLQGRIDHLGREMLCYGLDRESYVRGGAVDEWRRLEQTARPTLKELLLAESPRAEIPVPPRQGWHRRAPTPLE